MKNYNKPYKYKYNPIWVRVLSFFLGTFFVILGILTLIVVQGNVINFRKAQVIPSGSIRILSNVDGFKVYINGEQKTLVDNIVTGISQGEYLVEVTKPGYNSFKSVTPVTNGLVTDVNAHLFLKEPIITKAISEPLYQVFFGDNNGVIFANNSNSFFKKSFNRSLLSFLESDTKILFNKNSELFRLVEEKNGLQISPSSDFIFIVDKDDLYILPTSKDLNSVNLEEFKITPPYLFDKAQWLSDERIIFTSRNLAFDYNLKNKDFTIISLLSEENFSLYLNKKEGSVYLINNNFLYKYQNNQTIKIELPLLINNHKLIFANEKKVVLTKKYETIIINFEIDESETIKDFYAINSNNEATILQGYNENGDIVAAELIERITTKEIQIIPITPDEQFKNVDFDTINWAPNDAFFTFQEKNNASTIFVATTQINYIIPIFSSQEKILPKTLISEDAKSILVATESSDFKEIFRIEIE